MGEIDANPRYQIAAELEARRAEFISKDPLASPGGYAVEWEMVADIVMEIFRPALEAQAQQLAAARELSAMAVAALSSLQQKTARWRQVFTEMVGVALSASEVVSALAPSPVERVWPPADLTQSLVDAAHTAVMDDMGLALGGEHREWQSDGRAAVVAVLRVLAATGGAWRPLSLAALADEVEVSTPIQRGKAEVPDAD